MIRPRLHAYRVNRHEIWTGLADQPPEQGKHVATGTTDEATNLIISTLNSAFLSMEIAARNAGSVDE